MGGMQQNTAISRRFSFKNIVNAGILFYVQNDCIRCKYSENESTFHAFLLPRFGLMNIVSCSEFVANDER